MWILFMQRLNLCFALLIDFFTILFFAGDGKRRKKVGHLAIWCLLWSSEIPLFGVNKADKQFAYLSRPNVSLFGPDMGIHKYAE